MGKKQEGKKAAAKGKRAKEEATSVVGKAVDVVSGTTERGKAALGGLVSRGKDESQSALAHAKAAVDELVRLGVVQADRDTGGRAHGLRARHVEDRLWRRRRAGARDPGGRRVAAQGDRGPARRSSRPPGLRRPAARPRPASPPHGPPRPSPPRSWATARGTTAARSTAAKPAAKRTTAKPAAAKPASGTTRPRTAAAPAPTPAPTWSRRRPAPPAPAARRRRVAVRRAAAPPRDRGALPTHAASWKITPRAVRRPRVTVDTPWRSPTRWYPRLPSWGRWRVGKSRNAPCGRRSDVGAALRPRALLHQHELAAVEVHAGLVQHRHGLEGKYTSP